MPLDPKRTVAELKELRALTGNEDGAQRVAWTDTWEQARSGGTRMTLRNRGEPSGFGKVVAPLMASAMRRANQKDLAKLKSILESA